jgi:hypothetical protein
MILIAFTSRQWGSTAGTIANLSKSALNRAFVGFQTSRCARSEPAQPKLNGLIYGVVSLRFEMSDIPRHSGIEDRGAANYGTGYNHCQ